MTGFGGGTEEFEHLGEITVSEGGRINRGRIELENVRDLLQPSWCTGVREGISVGDGDGEGEAEDQRGDKQPLATFGWLDVWGAIGWRESWGGRMRKSKPSKNVADMLSFPVPHNW